MNFKRIYLAVIAAALALPGSLHAVQTSYWDVSGREEIGSGTADGVTVDPLGALELSPALEKVGEVDEYYVWSLTSDKNGNLYVGTGDQGKIYKVSADGDTELLFDSIELDILSLAVSEDGTVYAGTSPDGVIYRVGDDGGGKTFFDTPEHYIWALSFDDRGNLFAATGEQGKIYKISPDGTGDLFYDSPETNVICMEWDGPRNRFVCGGDGNGLVFTLDRDANPGILYDSPRDEVGDIIVREDGTIFAAVAGDKSSPKSEGNGNGAKAKALLYRIDPDGVAQILWESDSEFLFTLEEGNDGSLIAGTGSPGKLVHISPEGDGTDLDDFAEAQLLSLHRVGETVYLGTGNQGSVRKLGPGTVRAGDYTSEVKDVENLSRWGRIRWWGEAPKGTSVLLSTRAGNTEEPDETWSEWQVLSRADDRSGTIQSPPARFLQWKLELGGSGKNTPRVERVRIAYKEHNLPPRVLEVAVNTAETRFFDGPADPRPDVMHQVLSDGTRIEFFPPRESDFHLEEPKGNWIRSVRTARWQGADANGDKLEYSVYYRGERESEWKLLGEDITASYFSWDTRAIPDGVYRIRVVASDGPSNPAASSLTGQRTSDPFGVDNTAPNISSLEASRGEKGLEVSGRAEDGASPLLSAEYSLNADEWHPVDPVDEIYDSPKEQFDFSVSTELEGEQVLMLRVTDQAGNSALRQAVVR